MLHDVAAIVSLLVDEDEVPHLYDVLNNDLAFQVNKKNNAYSTFISTFNKGSSIVGEIKAQSIPPLLDLSILYMHQLNSCSGGIRTLCTCHSQLKLS